LYEVTKTAVGKDGHDIARFEAGKKVFENFLWTGQVEGFASRFADVVGDFLGIEAHLWIDLILTRNFCNIDSICGGEGLGELVLENTASGSI